MMTLLRCLPATLALLSNFVFAQSYTMTTVAGSNRLREGSQAKTVPLRYPYGVAQDSAGTVYFADSSDHRIRKIAADGTITTIAGTGVPGFSGDGGPGTRAK